MEIYKSIYLIVDPILNLLHISMLGHLYKKYKYKLEPVHILELNTLLDECLMIFILALRHFLGGQLGQQESWFCKISNIITFATRLSFYLDICWTQIDRFLALYWNIEYKERVTNNKTMVIIIITKLINLVLALFILWIDPAWFECQSGKAYQCSVYKKNNALYFTFPTTLSMATVIIVSSYAMRLILKIHSEVRPAVNENHPPASANIRTISKSVESINIMRKDSNPHLFFKKAMPRRMSEENISSCIPPSGQNILEKAKIVVRNNLMTFCILMMMLPNYVMNLAVYLEDKVCDEDVGFKYPGIITGLISLVSHLCIPFFVRKKLAKF